MSSQRQMQRRCISSEMMYPSLVLAVSGPIPVDLVAICFWERWYVNWLKADGVLLFVSSPNEGTNLAVWLLPQETKLASVDILLAVEFLGRLYMAFDCQPAVDTPWLCGEAPWEQAARWSNRQDSRREDRELLVGVTLTRDKGVHNLVLFFMLVDECKMWKLAGVKASESLEILHLSE